MLRRTLTAILSSFVLSLAFASAARAQNDATPTQQAHTPEQNEASPAGTELKEGARAYKEGRFAEAEQHFRRALELDPTHKNTPLFIARSIQQQYKPGDESAENIAMGERAVAAYRDIFATQPGDDEAYKAIVFLYGQMKRDDKVIEMITERANDSNVSEEKRAEAFVILASKQLQCSYNITERRENRTRNTKTGRVSYRMPADPADFAKARQCADEGLQLIEQAVSLNPNSMNAWNYKANLLREASKLAEMQGDTQQKEELEKQYAEAFDAQKRAGAEENRRNQEQQRSPTPEAKPEAKPDSTPPTSSPIEEL